MDHVEHLVVVLPTPRPHLVAVSPGRAKLVCQHFKFSVGGCALV